MRRIFSILVMLLGTLALQGQSARELIQEDVLRAGGVYYMYPFKEHKVTPPPAGYTPVYLSHYGRHGARYLLNDTQYERSLGVLKAAHEAGALTPEGESLWQEASAYFEETCRYKAGNLTPLGWEQHYRIAQEIYRDNRKLFRKRPVITAGATQVPRCIVSMTAFCQGLLKADSKLDIYAAASTAELDEINPHAEENPFRQIVSMEEGRYKRTDPWGTNLKTFIDKRIDHNAICARIFKDPEFTKPYRGTRSFVTDLYDLVFNMQCTGTTRSLVDVFNPVGNVDAARRIRVEPHELKRKRPDPTDGLARPVAEIARPVIPALVDSVQVAFGTLECRHKEIAFGADGFGLVPDSADGISEHWWNFRSPMAATMYLVFCRNKKGDVLFKMVLNGDEARLPLTPVSGPWYSWAECKKQIVNLIITII